MTALELVGTLLDKANEYRKDLDLIEIEYSKALANVKELERQLNVHQMNNDITDATIVKGQLQTANSYLLKWSIEKTRVTGLYEDALAYYKSQKAALLTTDEIVAANASEIEKLEELNAVTELQLKGEQQKAAGAEAKAAAEKRKKIIITVVVVVLVSVLAYFGYKKFIKKS